MNYSISIIIPCLNEENNLYRLLSEIRRQKNVSPEIIVVDGGSQDNTLEIAKKSGATVLSTQKGRGHQMNEGARVAQHKILCFMHADSYLQDDFLIYHALQKFHSYSAVNIAGHFPLLFVRDNSKKSLAYFHYEEKSKLNREYVFGGDQGLIIYQDFFQEVGRFDEELHFLEDKKISLEIIKRGEMVTLPGNLGTSARRFQEEGFTRRMILNLIIIVLFHISYQPFFKQAFKLYRRQGTSSRLNMHFFFSLVHSLYIQEPLTNIFGMWYKVGKFTRGNIWQIFFGIDVCFDYFFKRKTFFLKLHDKILFPLTNFWLFDLIVMMASFFLFYICWLCFWLIDVGRD